MAERRIRRWSAVALAALVAVTVVALVLLEGAHWPPILWATAIAAGQLVPVPSPGGGRLYAGIGVAAAVPLVIEDPWGVAAAFAGGLAGSWVVLRLRREPDRQTRMFLLSQVTALSAYGLVYFVVRELGESRGSDVEYAMLLAAAAGGLAWLLAGAVTAAAVEYEQEGYAFRYLWLRPLADWPAVVSLFAAGVMFAFAYPAVGWWAFPVALLPYGFSHVSFIRYQGSRVTYRQTIRALARIPEVAGLAPQGHAVRTAGLAVEVAKEMGLSPSDVADVEYAALMHDIGRITLNEPAILKAGYTDEDIARWGSQIVAEAPSLRRVAEYVRQQHEPYRSPGVELDESVPTPAKIIKVSSAYDQAVFEAGLPPIEAIETLHRGAAYDFDPKVVSALRRIIGRRGAIPY
jgi:hypothetical protein